MKQDQEVFQQRMEAQQDDGLYEAMTGTTVAIANATKTETGLEPRSAIANPQSPIRNQPIRNRQSAISQSAIANRQSAIT